MSITRVKEMFIIFINLSLRKRQISYKISDWLQILETKTTTKKKRKKEEEESYYENYFFFITIFFFD